MLRKCIYSSMVLSYALINSLNCQETYFFKHYGGGSTQQGRRVLMADSSFYVVGTRTGGNLDKGFFSRINSSGELVMNVDLQSGTNSLTWVNSGIKSRDGNFLVTGISLEACGNCTYDAYLAKIDVFGQVLSEAVIGGATSHEMSYDLYEHPDGNLYFAGAIGNTVGSSFYFFKTDSSGNLIFDEKYLYPNFNWFTYLYGSSGGTYVAAGIGNSSIDSSVVRFYRLDENGNILLEKTVRALDWTYCEGFQPTNDGGWLAVGGTVSSPPFDGGASIIKVDSMFDVDWTFVAGFSSDLGAFHAIDTLSNGQLILVGSGRSSSAGWDDIQISGFSRDGKHLWSREIGKPDLMDDAYDLFIEDDDDILVTGTTASYTSPGSTSDVFLWKVNCLGFMNSPEASFTTTFDSLDPNTTIFINASQYAGSYHWDFGDGDSSSITSPTHTYSDTGLYIVTLIAFGCKGERDTLIDTIRVGSVVTEGIWHNTFDTDLDVYPNPVASDIFVHIHPDLSDGCTQFYRLYDARGTLTCEGTLSVSSGQNRINVEGFTPGLYLLAIWCDDSIRNFRLIKK